tara:strand:+ start:365 stop:1519 length:1155 start_codon:yes stop_codon:yes gene_type:complete
MFSCSGGSSTQSVEDVGDDTSGENSGGNGGGVIPEPVASFTVSSYGGEAPIDITFTSTSTGEINSWLWNVDDDADYESNYYSFTHTYENSGTYDISLIVTGPGGQSTITQNDAITITEPETNVETGLSSQSMMYDNENREYLIYIPQNYNNNNSPMPILFAFHGFGGYSQYFINTADFRSLADQYNFIIVYPQALICNGGTTWNTNPPGGDNKCSQDDIGFFGALLYELIGNYNIDSSKVFLTGYSNGADFSYSMACFQSSLITAIAPVSGLMPMYDPSECSPSHATSVLITNGTNDGSRPYNGIDGYMMSVDSTISYWAGYNNADSTPEVITEGNIERYLYANGDNDTEAILLKVVNGGHDWFNMTLGGLSFEQIIWQFFSNN